MAIAPWGGVQTLHCCYTVTVIPLHAYITRLIGLRRGSFERKLIHHAGFCQMIPTKRPVGRGVVVVGGRDSVQRERRNYKVIRKKYDKTKTVVGGMYLYGNSRFCHG